MKHYSISLISYLNSRPFLYGLENHPIRDSIRIFLDIPSKTAIKLIDHQADIGLVPVGALTDLPGHRIISDYCISAAGAVRTVVLASDVPLEEIETVLLDYQSRSSVLLVRVLARFFWKKEFRWEKSSAGYEKKAISGKTAAVVIGDRVFEVEKRFRYIFDLSAEWMKFSGLPFVFAVWVAMEELPAAFRDLFNTAVGFGVKSVPEVEELVKDEYPGVDLNSYFNGNISYLLNDPKRQGMARFLELATRLREIMP
ncbi:MAG: menaquinone biosynthesis protein [Prolixibacteraceae bacterium]|jgi:chorismate dehydratase|nr:menaquinone biosynthesis protein [Prolixibacteraceae bacterium]MDI9564367.1 menaquinone biosynthesis protein [Bacteroidota bacterium]NLT00383.1 menaquinone biosynthesis protein [Bacteroidales bacterium]OQB79932.1 MAG: Chorismate dehydratase [Bacteroidetes bacterium ADurb.Bin123]HNU78419.1 menaquinone biosynthesis protein [Prolixibacteraceae bacterium]